MNNEYYNKIEINEIFRENTIDILSLIGTYFGLIIGFFSLVLVILSYLISQKIKEVEKLKTDVSKMEDFLNGQAIEKYSEKIYQSIIGKKLDDIIRHPENFDNVLDELLSINIKGDINRFKLLKLYDLISDKNYGLIILIRNYPVETFCTPELIKKITTNVDSIFYSSNGKLIFFMSEIEEIYSILKKEKNKINKKVFQEIDKIFMGLQGKK